jgi:hypothetical protein
MVDEPGQSEEANSHAQARETYPIARMRLPLEALCLQ